MSDVNTLLNQRLGRKEKSAKMIALAQKSASGDLNGFAGIFGVGKLSPGETASLEHMLQNYAQDDANIGEDLRALIAITSEIKGIHNQAAILHGERIKRAHDILTHYREGAFTAWLVNTYGNRQTPYNLWHYYEFYQATPRDLRPQLEAMPRQAVYTLASREGRFETKQRIVREYAGETKGELLARIRQSFPLAKGDQRAENHTEAALKALGRALVQLKAAPRRIGPGPRRQIIEILNAIRALVSD